MVKRGYFSMSPSVSKPAMTFCLPGLVLLILLDLFISPLKFPKLLVSHKISIHEGLNGVPPKSVINKTLRPNLVINKILTSKSVISTVLKQIISRKQNV